MDLKALHYFVEIVNCGGFNRAANKVHISQPALSKSLNQLEAELELPLLSRGKRGTNVSLTVHGEVVYRYAQQLLTTKQELFDELNQLKGLNRGELKLGMAPLGSAELFAPIIAKYRRQYPNIKTQLLVRGGVEQTSALLQGEIELATGIFQLNQEFDDIAIHQESMVVVLPSRHPLAQRTQVPMSQLNGYSQILFEPEFSLYNMVIDASEKAGVIIDNPTLVNQPDFGVALVAADIGVMILPKFIAMRYQSEGVVCRDLIETELTWRMSLFWPKNKPLSFAATAMIKLLKQHLEEQQSL